MSWKFASGVARAWGQPCRHLLYAIKARLVNTLPRTKFHSGGELPPASAPAPAPAREETQLSLGDAAGQEALDRLRAASLDTMSPIEAMNLLFELKQLV